MLEPLAFLRADDTCFRQVTTIGFFRSANDDAWRDVMNRETVEKSVRTGDETLIA
jgi:hypothetical protein